MDATVALHRLAVGGEKSRGKREDKSKTNTSSLSSFLFFDFPLPFCLFTNRLSTSRMSEHHSRGARMISVQQLDWLT
jgi:hypothetical protein